MADQVQSDPTDRTGEFVPSEEQRALRAAVDDYTARRWDDDRLRAVLDSAERDPRDLRILGTDLGVLAIALPEARGGDGAGLAVATVVAERLGRRLAAVPFTSALLAAEVLAGTDAVPSLLGDLVTGERLVVVVATDERGRWLPEQSSISATETDRGWSLTGTAAHVVDAADAATFLVLVGDTILVVDAAATGITRTPITSMDLTRPQQTLAFAETLAVPVCDNGRALVLAATDRAVVCLAAEALGAAERLLEVSVAHATARIQFGRTIGSYQGVKHRLADLLIAVEQTRSLVEHAAWSADHLDGPDDDEPALTASAARVVAAETLIAAAATAIQVHGGIGFTWEHLAHLYFKRAHSDAVLWGGLVPHRERVAALALDTLVV
ncbi:acyl-CoA dehydrogenase family protein [soil metagenome]